MKKLLVLSVAALLAVPAFAAQQFTVDPSHSNVGFTIKHLMSKVSGSFNEFEGQFTFDEKNPSKSSANMTIKIDSIDTNNDKRDDHLKSADFFDEDKHPTMTFKSTKATKVSGKKYKLVGDLTMKGVTKPATFDVEYLGTTTGMTGKPTAGFTATAKVNRKDFGLNWNKALDKGGYVLGDDVLINVQVEAVEAETEKK